MFLGSDAIALGPFTDAITYLDDGDCVVITAPSATIYDAKGEETARAGHHDAWARPSSPTRATTAISW